MSGHYAGRRGNRRANTEFNVRYTPGETRHARGPAGAHLERCRLRAGTGGTGTRRARSHLRSRTAKIFVSPS